MSQSRLIKSIYLPSDTEYRRPGGISVGVVDARSPGCAEIVFSSGGPTFIGWPSIETVEIPDMIGLDNNPIDAAGDRAPARADALSPGEFGGSAQ